MLAENFSEKSSYRWTSNGWSLFLAARLVSFQCWIDPVKGIEGGFRSSRVVAIAVNAPSNTKRSAAVLSTLKSKTFF
jgi:hypothetical protein